jgi:small subunit ribosomal protein S15
MAEKADWTKIKPAEIEKIIVDLARQGTPPEKIGLILRDQHGVPKAKLLGVKIGKVLAKNKLGIDSEKKNLTNKVENLKKHSLTNKHDYTAMRKAVMYSAIIKKKEKLAGQ